jgi:hypothetical protein
MSEEEPSYKILEWILILAFMVVVTVCLFELLGDSNTLNAINKKTEQSAPASQSITNKNHETYDKVLH